MTGKAIIVVVLLGMGIALPGARAQQSGKIEQNSPAATTHAAPMATGTPQIDDIHDIKPLRAPGLSPWLRYGLPAALLAAVLAALFVYYRHKNAAPPAHAIAPDPPDVAALRALDELARRDDLDGRRFYFRLSAILRGYLAQRFGIDALEMTTEELLPAIGRLDLGDSLPQQLIHLLRCAEPIKFAGQPAAKDQMLSDLAFGRGFVKQTKPVEQDENV